LSDQRWVPVILMSPVSDQADIVRGLEAGADDYLVKPINLQVLEAKLRSFQRIADLHRQSEDNARILAQYRDQAEAELEIATSLIGAITQQGNLQDRQLTWSVIPSSRFSGDTVAALRTPSGRLLAMLADATGHGLPAAISLLPALEVFYGMAGKDLGLGEIVREINRRMWEHMPTGLYLAAVLLSVDMLDRSVEIWNGGMPPGLWVRAGSGVHSEALGSRHPPLGILGEESFDATSSRLEAAGDGHLVFYSDGLVEAINAEGEPFGALRLCSQLVGRSPAAGLRATIAALQAHLCGQPAQDDISVLMVGLD
jgi:serine phosphatase RsbU (regulator of sigma subunit)